MRHIFIKLRHFEFHAQLKASLGNITAAKICSEESKNSSVGLLQVLDTGTKLETFDGEMSFAGRVSLPLSEHAQPSVVFISQPEWSCSTRSQRVIECNTFSEAPFTPTPVFHFCSFLDSVCFANDIIEFRWKTANYYLLSRCCFTHLLPRRFCVCHWSDPTFALATWRKLC